MTEIYLSRDGLINKLFKILDAIFTEKTMENPIMLIHCRHNFSIDDIKEPCNTFGFLTIHNIYQIFPDLLKIQSYDPIIGEFIHEFHLNNGYIEFQEYITTSIFVQFKEFDINDILLHNVYFSNNFKDRSYMKLNFVEYTVQQIKEKVYSNFIHQYKIFIINYLKENPTNTVESYIKSKTFYKNVWFIINNILHPIDVLTKMNEIKINRQDIFGHIERCTVDKTLKIFDKDDDELECFDNIYYEVYIGQFGKKLLILSHDIIV